MSPLTTQTTVSPALRAVPSFALAVLTARGAESDFSRVPTPFLEWAQRIQHEIERQGRLLASSTGYTTETQDRPVQAARRASLLTFLDELLIEGADPDHAWWSEFDGQLRERRFQL